MQDMKQQIEVSDAKQIITFDNKLISKFINESQHTHAKLYSTVMRSSNIQVWIEHNNTVQILSQYLH